MSDGEPVKIYEAWNSMQAHFLCQQLAEAGIAARVASSAVEALIGKVPYQKATCPVLVAQADEDRARSVVAEYEARLSGRGRPEDDAVEPFCYHCGAALEARQNQCPQCGGELDWSE